MIKATITRSKAGGNILVVGHAPRPPGAEITGNLECAAVSFLTSLTAEALADIAGAKVEASADDYDGVSGGLSFSWTGGGAAADTIAAEWFYGMKWAAEQYPGTIEITEQPA